MVRRTYNSCRSDVHSIMLIRPTQELQINCQCVVDIATKKIAVPVANKFLVGCTYFCRLDEHFSVYRMNIFCASDLLQKVCIQRKEVFNRLTVCQIHVTFFN